VSTYSGQELTRQEAEALVKRIDKDQDYRISYTEFLAAFSLERVSTQQKISIVNSGKKEKNTQ
jgi:Ca2+-binding EF-hand superfamily protein